MSPITIGFLVLLLGFLVSLYKFLRTGYAFVKYIRKKHPAEWKDMAHKDKIRNALFPFGKGAATYFIYKSKDDLGDAKIAQFRKRIRQHTLFLVVVYPLSFLTYIVLIFWFLETMVEGGHGGGFRFFWD